MARSTNTWNLTRLESDVCDGMSAVNSAAGISSEYSRRSAVTVSPHGRTSVTRLASLSDGAGVSAQSAGAEQARRCDQHPSINAVTV
jgi:hypothetical protein